MSSGKKNKREKSEFRETISTILQALLLALIIRTILFQPFSIPSQSMVPTLLIGDYLIVSKFSYGYSKNSLPLSPNLFSGRIFASEPERGDVAVFKTPTDNETDYIKRVIGLPGDEIQMKQGRLFINGEAVKTEEVKDPIEENHALRQAQGLKVYKETLKNGVSYLTYDTASTQGENTPVFKVPDGHYFMMGDNRNHSLDSRFAVGYVPFENFIGRADIIFFSIKDRGAWQIWRWFSDARFSRIFNKL